jgi:TrmH family RNA methyltransferase
MKALIRTIRDLHRRRGREQKGLALAEGVRLVEEALAAGITIKGAVVSPALQGTTRGRALEAALGAGGVSVESVDDAELAELADTEHPQGVVAVIEPPQWSLNTFRPAAGVVLVLDGVQDPGNVGTMARTAFALGAAGLIALKGTADLANPKVLRGSMGALFRFPSFMTDDVEFLAWRETTGTIVVLTDPTGTDVGHYRRPRGNGLALIVGNEGAGIRKELEAVASARLAIPLTQGAESLNVAVAAGILLYEVLRDR